MDLARASGTYCDDFLKVIASIGQEGFSRSVLACLRRASLADMFSAFVKTRTGRVDFVCADSAGAKQASPVALSLLYAREYWQRDPMMGSRPPIGKGAFQRQFWSNIPDGDYRTTCYVRPRVIERVSTCLPRDRDLIFLNMYRQEESGPFRDDDLQRFNQIALELAACVGSHDRLTQKGIVSLRPPHTLIEGALRAAEPNLSVREAQVCAGILQGKAMKVIANTISLEISSVITYKKRAFQKLDISTRMELQEVYERGLRLQ